MVVERTNVDTILKNNILWGKGDYMNNSWEQKWLEDIDFLSSNLKSKHKNLFFNISEEDFNYKIDSLKLRINDLDYNEMKVEISRVVASIGDAHTALTFPAKKYLGVKFYWFEDGIYIIRGTYKYRDLLYKKVDSINGVAISEVVSDIADIVSCENQYLLKAQTTKYMQVAEVLYGLLIIDDMDSIKIVLEGEEFELETISPSEIDYINEDKLPLYARQSMNNFWYHYIEENNEIYIKYNSCRESGSLMLSEKIQEAILFIEENYIVNVTIDLRNNLGGDSTLLRDLIDYIKGNNKINKKENLRVIIGRETFSSALLNAYEFKNETNAKIIGEPSGGKPNCYGEILKITLPNSKLNISYSTKFYKLIEDDKVMALYVDELIYEKIEDYYVSGN